MNPASAMAIYFANREKLLNSRFPKEVLPKKNATTGGSEAWRRSMRSFVEATDGYLKEYYRRNNSESGFSADKRMLGWTISQRRFDRMECAILCRYVWHNLFRLRR